MTYSQTFRAAADIVDHQQTLPKTFLRDADGNYCLMGAVLRILNINTDQDWSEELENLDEVRLLALFLDQFYPRFKCVSNWNDKSGRTPDEAAAFLRNAAKYLDDNPELVKAWGFAGGGTKQ